MAGSPNQNPEQQESVRPLDEPFEVIEREIDGALRQAMLQNAFTGCFVPQDPADEPVSELLARLRTERLSTPQLGHLRTARKTKNRGVLP